ncbi:pyridoxamine 5'-phosphate oxidase family protein [Oceanibacterium hippocampi]|uniref:Pyridoxamine 5'-phosphate oxidase n=1 Tax=Oceanibacterium hippocampi TaxID=745714 RepID=A0A1Y5SU84_9PROT|nr:pyridoxamine 5'-phosphate oxidase family protein [Oceanibacterium hippocampi]SLN47045.1 Pyridoxamine 5'-phosphate oxidase [Oceanibacterium hippocampi]
MPMNEAMRSEMDRAVLCWLATVSADGLPNVSPKEIFATLDGNSLVIADIASPASVRNARANPKVCVAMVDVFRQRGFKITGTARIIGPGEADFATLGRDLLAKAGDAFPIRHVILVHIARISRIWAPSYSLFPGRSEEARMQAAYRTYGVQPHVHDIDSGSDKYV